MTMTSPRSLPPLRRLVLESLAVILSILLAFAIDAWWDGHKQRERERDLLAALMEDFRSSRPGLVDRLTLSRRNAAGTASLLTLVDAYPPGTRVPVPDSLVLAALGGPTFEPATDALDAALASGEIEIIASHEIRAELATWRRRLTDTTEDEHEVRRITNEQLVPALARSMSLRPYFDALLAWSGGDPHGAGRLIEGARASRGESAGSLVSSTELVGALSLRKFYVQFSAAGLQDLLASLDRVVALLEGELGPRGLEP